MAKPPPVDRVNEYFYSGTVLAGNRESILYFSGVYTAPETVTISEIHDFIINLESNYYGRAVVLTALNRP